MPTAGVQLNVPEVLVPLATKVALWPAGSTTRLALSELIASPSGSEADTTKLISVDSLPPAVGVTVTTAARSTFETVIALEPEPDWLFDAVNDTV